MIIKITNHSINYDVIVEFGHVMQLLYTLDGELNTSCDLRVHASTS